MPTRTIRARRATTPVVRPVYLLHAQAVGYRRDTFRVVTAQHWKGFVRGLDAFVLTCNDEITGRRLATPSLALTDFKAASDMLAPHTVTEDRARDLLERMSKPRERLCEECRAVLPLGGLYCRRCGLPGGVAPT